MVVLLGLKITALWFLVVEPELVFLPQLSRSISPHRQHLPSTASRNNGNSFYNSPKPRTYNPEAFQPPKKPVGAPEKARENQKDERGFVGFDQASLSDPLSQSLTNAPSVDLSSLSESADQRYDQGQHGPSLEQEKKTDQEIKKPTESVIKDPPQDPVVPGLPIVFQRHVLVTV